MADASQSLNIEILLKGMEEFSHGLKEAAATIAEVVISAEALKKLFEGVNQITELGEKMDILSQQTDIAISKALVLQQVFKEAGAGGEMLGTTIAFMSRSLVTASTAGGPAADALEKIHLRASELLALSPDEQFRAIAKGIGEIENPAQRSQVAMALFSRGGKELTPLFREFDEAMAKAEERMGGLPGVMQRNSKEFREFQETLKSITTIKPEQFFSGFTSQLIEPSNGALKVVDLFDMTGVGEKAGAIVRLFYEAFQEGKLDELIGLIIEAGFELGTNAVVGTWRTMMNFIADFTDSKLAAALLNGVLVGGVEAAKALIEILAAPITALHAMIDVVTDYFRFGFENAARALSGVFAKMINAIGSQLELVLNFWIKAFDKIAPKSLQVGSVAFGGVHVDDAAFGTGKAKTFDEALTESSATAAEQATKATQFLNQSLKETQHILGLTEKDWNGQTTAVAALSEKINELVLRTHLNSPAGSQFEGDLDNRPIPGIGFTKQDLEKTLEEVKQKTIDANLAMGLAAADFSKTDVEKWEERKKALTEEGEYLDGIIEKLKKAAEATEDPALKREIEKAGVGLSGQRGQNRVASAGMGADPNDFTAQLTSKMTALRSSWGTMVQQMAGTLTNAMSAAFNGISNGIQGLIMGTITWGEALKNIGTGIVTSIVKSFSDMVASWIVTHVIMKGVSLAWAAFSSALGWAKVAESNAQEAAKVPALSFSALLASIGSFGWAAIVGVAAIAAILAHASGAFYEGGYTGDGSPSSVAGAVHKREFVFDHGATSTWGIDNLEKMRSGQLTPGMVFGGAGIPAINVAGGGGANVRNNIVMGFHSSEPHARAWADSQEGEKWYIDMGKKHYQRINPR